MLEFIRPTDVKNAGIERHALTGLSACIFIPFTFQAMSDVGSLVVKCWDRNPTKRLMADKMLQRVKDVYLVHEMRPTYCAVELHSAGEEDSLLGDPSIELDCNASQAIIYSNNVNRSTYL